MEKHQITGLYTIPTETPHGLFYIITDAKADTVLASGFGTLCDIRKRLPPTLQNTQCSQHPHVASWQKIVTDYFSGNATKMQKVSVTSYGSPFQEKVWSALRTIPFGGTVTYKELATMVGNPRAIRAVGTACAKNPNILFTPCHRVVKSSGEIGEYACGTKIKKHLLDLEKNNITNNS